MAFIIVDIDVVDSRMSNGKVLERLVEAEVLEGEHVDRANEIALPVIRQKRPRGERLGINIERSEAGEKIWQLHERAHFPEGSTGRGLQLRCLCSCGGFLGELRLQGMMERMQGMMGRQGMGMMPQEEEETEDASPPRGMMGMGGMIRRHLARLAQQLALTDDQRAQVRTLLGNHAKEAIRLRADIGVMTVDIRQLLEADPVDLPKVKQLLQSIAGKEVDLRVAHITLMQEIGKLLTPEQRQKFRAMRESIMGPGSMMSRGRSEQ